MRRLAVMVAAAVPALAACEPATVELDATPPPGATYEYRYQVDTVVRRSIEDEPDQDRTASTVLRARWEVLPAAAEGPRARVTLTREGAPDQTVIVALDRPGLLASVALDELSGDAAAGELERLVPPAAMVPPDVPLAPGDTWETSEVIDVGGTRTADLDGYGRFDRFELRQGRRAGVVTTVVDLSVDLALGGATSSELRGTQRARLTAAYDLADGSVEWARARTSGTAVVIVAPPPEIDAEPVRVLLDYEVRVRTDLTARSGPSTA